MHKLFAHENPGIVQFAQIEKTFQKPIDFWLALWYNVLVQGGKLSGSNFEREKSWVRLR